MSLLGHEYLSVAIGDDPPGQGDVRTTIRPRRPVTIRWWVPTSAGGSVARHDTRDPVIDIAPGVAVSPGDSYCRLWLSPHR